MRFIFGGLFIDLIYYVFELKFLDENSGANDDLKLEFALFGDCYKTNDLSGCEGPVDGESITIAIRSQVPSLVAYFTEFPALHFLLQASCNTVAKTSFDMIVSDIFQMKL